MPKTITFKETVVACIDKDGQLIKPCDCVDYEPTTPFIDKHKSLVIPFECDDSFKWWFEGSAGATRKALKYLKRIDLRKEYYTDLQGLLKKRLVVNRELEGKL